jgi:hypothetical protein
MKKKKERKREERRGGRKEGKKKENISCGRLIALPLSPGSERAVLQLAHSGQWFF